MNITLHFIDSCSSLIWDPSRRTQKIEAVRTQHSQLEGSNIPKKPPWLRTRVIGTGDHLHLGTCLFSCAKSLLRRCRREGAKGRRLKSSEVTATPQSFPVIFFVVFIPITHSHLSQPLVSSRRVSALCSYSRRSRTTLLTRSKHDVFARKVSMNAFCCHGSY